jgi:hypothetical protein
MTQNDPIVGTSLQHVAPIHSQIKSDNPPEHPMSIPVPLDEIRRQNDVERWRNKLRLQEKFQVNYLIISFRKSFLLYLAITQWTSRCICIQ